MSDLAQLQALVRGSVQGVGFRFFVRDMADILRLTGYVRNLPDGLTVEVVAEGPKASLEALLRALAKGPSGSRVEEVDAHWGPLSGRFSTFEVRYY